MNTGHKGILATIHASSAEQAVHRLAALAIRSAVELNVLAVETEIERSLDLIIYISRHETKRVIEDLLQLPRKF